MTSRWIAVGAVGMIVSVVGAVASVPAVAARPPHASAVLRDTAGRQVGTVKFHEDGTGRVHVNIHVQGLPPGQHGLHVHAVGSCATPAGGPPFAGAGSHHNPLGATHPHHAGDLGNLTVGRNGKGHVNGKVTSFTLGGGTTKVFDGDGSAVVVHERRDDLKTDPTGDSGGRIACGVLQLD